jgi:4-amino-4-deoxy-L-arabinose transferase-like glycosyltransferase
VAFLWALRLGGALAGVTAAATVALSPLVHAHGALVLTDLMLGLFALAAAAAAHLALERRSAPWAVAAGAVIACAMHTKYPGAIVGVAVACGFAVAVATRALPGKEPGRLLAFASAGAIAAFLLQLDRDGLAAYAEGVRRMGTNYLHDYRYYLLGTDYAGSHPAYFPATLLLKSSLVELAGIVALLPIGAWLAARGRIVTATLLVAFPLLYFAALVVGAQNLGHRYTAPLYGFFAIALALATTRARPRLQVPLVAGIVAVQFATALVATPDPLSYFNGLLGCRGHHAWHCLDDSNLDWGQNLTRIEAELARRGVPRDAVIVDVPFIHAPDVVLADVAKAEYRDWVSPRPAYYVVSAHTVVRRVAHQPAIRHSALFATLERADYYASHFLIDLRAAPPTPRQD